MLGSTVGLPSRGSFCWVIFRVAAVALKLLLFVLVLAACLESVTLDLAVLVLALLAAANGVQLLAFDVAGPEPSAVASPLCPALEWLELQAACLELVALDLAVLVLALVAAVDDV